MIKGSIQEEDITIINIYPPNMGAPQYVRQILTSMKGEINNNTIIVGDLIPHSHLWIDQLNRKLTRKKKNVSIKLTKAKHSKMRYGNKRR